MLNDSDGTPGAVHENNSRQKKIHEKFTELYNHYVGLVRSILREKMGFRKQDIDDMAQEVFIEIYRCLLRMPEDPAEKRKWVAAVTRNLAVDHIRKEKTQKRTPPGGWGEYIEENQPDDNRGWETGGWDPVTRALAMRDPVMPTAETLSREDRLFLRFVYRGESHERIARRYNVNEKTIRRWLNKIRKKIVTEQ